MKKMWKPSKRLVTWILVILLMYNIATLVLTGCQMSTWSVSAPIIPDSSLRSDGLHVWYPEVTWWIEEMNKIDNNPRIVTDHGRGNWVLSPYDETVLYGFRLERIGSSVRLAETSEIIGHTTTAARSNWIKNLLVPWMHENTLYYFSYYGVFENIIVYNSSADFYENKVGTQWENLNYVFVLGVGYSPDTNFSPWGAIHFAIVLGALIYVRKRWH